MNLQFLLRGLRHDAPDRVIEMLVQASNADAARQQAEEDGIIVLSLSLRSAARGPAPSHWRAQDLAWWCRELRTLLGAGMTVVEALETLEAQTQPQAQGVRQLAQSALLARLRQGESLSRALETVGGFPPVLRASVRAAERTGALGAALDDFLRYHELLDRLRRRVIRAAVYPLLVCIVGALVCAFLLLGVLPRFAGILEGTQAELGAGTALLLGFSQLLRTHGLASALLVLLAALSLLQLWRRGDLARAAGWLMRRIPPVARALKSFELAKLYQALALLYRGGYPLEEALEVCRQAALAEGGAAAERLASSQQALRQGQGVAKALLAGGLADELTRRLLAVGERAGSFDRILQAVAERHAQSFGDFIDRLMRVVEPLLLLMVASVVGAVVVLMYLPIFDIATGLQA